MSILFSRYVGAQPWRSPPKNGAAPSKCLISLLAQLSGAAPGAGGAAIGKLLMLLLAQPGAATPLLVPLKGDIRRDPPCPRFRSLLSRWQSRDEARA